MEKPILVTGAAGRVGAVGRTVTEQLLKQGKPVRATMYFGKSVSDTYMAATVQRGGGGEAPRH